jgi:hypothetical protein
MQNNYRALLFVALALCVLGLVLGKWTDLPRIVSHACVICGISCVVLHMILKR